MKSILTYILLCLIWGSTWIAIKIGLYDAPPFYSVSIRFVVAITVLMIFMLIRRQSFPKTVLSFIQLGLPGLLMYSTGYASVYIAEMYISSSLAAVLISTIPFFTALGTIFLLPSEKIDIRGWLAMAVGFVGVSIISYDAYEQSLDLFIGSLLMLVAAASAAFGTIVQKKYFSDRPVLTSVTTQMIIGALPLTVVAFFFESPDQIQFTAEFIGSVLYLGIFGSVIAFLGYYWLLKKVSTITISLIAFITPVVAMIIGIGFFDESFTLKTIIGTALILFGVLGVIKKTK